MDYYRKQKLSYYTGTTMIMHYRYNNNNNNNNATYTECNFCSD